MLLMVFRITDAASANDCYIGYSVYFSGTYLYHYKGSPIPLDLSSKSGLGYKWIYGGLIANSIPFSFVLVFLVYIVSYYLLNKATYGRHIYAVGGSEEAAKLSGINTKLTMILAYVACGVMAAIAGIIISAKWHPHSLMQVKHMKWMQLQPL